MRNRIVLVFVGLCLLYQGAQPRVWPSQEQMISSEEESSADYQWGSGSHLLKANLEEDEECRVLPPLPNRDDDTLTLSLWELLDKSGKELVLDPSERAVTLLLGNTGSGKTTVTQIVAGNTSALEVVETHDGNIIIIDPGQKIGMTTASRTLVPELVVDPETGMAIYDCPGFSDNRGPNTDIAVNFLLKKVTDHVTSVKLAFVVIYSSVFSTNDKTDFDRLATSAVRMGKDLEKLADSIGLVVTKAPNNDPRNGRKIKDEIIMKSVRAFLEMYKGDQEKMLNEIRPGVDKRIIQKKVQFVDILLKENRIGVVRTPQECGPITNSEATMKTKQELRKLFNEELAFVSTQPSDFGYALTDSSLLQIDGYVRDLNENITSSAYRLVDKIRKEHLEKLESLNDFEEVKDFVFQEYANFSQTLSEIRDNSTIGLVPKRFARAIKNVLNKRSYDSTLGKRFYESMKQIGEYLDFFEAMKPSTNSRDLKGWIQPFQDWIIEETGKRKDWYDFLSRLDNELSSFNFQGKKPKVNVPAEPTLSFVKNQLNLGNLVDNRMEEIFSSYLLTDEDKIYLSLLLKQGMETAQRDCKGDTMKVTGVHVKVSDFTEENGSYSCPSARKVEIFALKKFFIDRNISPNHEETQELSIMAPTWEVVTPSLANINLDGAKGHNHSPLKASTGGAGGVEGVKGEPGLPGYPGGRFYGVANKIINQQNLRVTANGGEGGDGQEGGDGSEGRKGRKVEYDEFPSCYGASWWSRASKYFDKIWDGSAKHFEFWCTKYGDAGYKGGNGGAGGVGGEGGIPGVVEILQISNGNNVAVNSAKGATGSSGKGGKGGLGGERGDGTTAMMATAGPFGCGYQQIRTEYVSGQRSESGSQGTAGGNSQGKKPPAKPEFSLVKWTLINDYKAFVMSKESPHLRNHFICELENRTEIAELYDPVAFSHELLGLEQNSLTLKNEKKDHEYAQIVLDKYISFMTRVENYGNSNDLTWSDKKILAILYTTAMSHRRYFKDILGGTAVTDVEGYLKTVLTRFDRYKDVQTQVVIDEERKGYAATFQKKIEQALTFIDKTVNPAVDGVERELRQTQNELLAQVVKMMQDAEDREKEAKIAMQRMKETMAFRHIFTALKIGSTVASFLGPQAAAVGGIIGTAASIGEKFALSDNSKLRPQIPLPASVKRYADSMETQVKESNEDEIKRIDAIIDTAKKTVKENKETMADIQKNIDELEKFKKDFEEKRHSSDIMTYLSMKDKIKVSEKLLEDAMEEKKVKIEKAQKGQEGTEEEKEIAKKHGAKALRAISTFKNVVTTTAELGLDIYNNYKNDEAKMEEMAKMVKEAEIDVNRTRAYKESITNTLEPVTAAIAEDLYNVTQNLEGQSAVSLQVQKWQVKQQLNEYKFFLQDFTEGQATQKKFAHVVDKLSEAMTLITDLYDYIEKYQEQMDFADYIANINSPNALKIAINNEEAARYISRIQLALQSNILLGEYQRVVQTFKQWVFPFADIYSDEFHLKKELPDYLNITSDINTPEQIQLFLIPMLKDQVSNLKLKLKEYKSRTFPGQDVNLIKTSFNSEQISTHPFFVWRSEDEPQMIRDLLSGKMVKITADSDYAYTKGKSAVKFSIAEIQPKARDTEKNAKLLKLLNEFAVEMTHSGVSHYTFDDKSYEMVGDNVTLSYSFERKDNGDRLGPNMIYEKVKDGDLFLSPYTVWNVELFRAKDRSKQGFDKLIKFLDREDGLGAPIVDLELIGEGTFVDEKRNRKINLEVMSMFSVDAYEMYLDGGSVAPSDEIWVVHPLDEVE